MRLDDAAAGAEVARALAAGGVTAIEVTMTVPNAVRLIAELSASLGDDILVGAGTVLGRRDRPRSDPGRGAVWPTGGVTRSNAGDWLRAGAVAIGVGTALVDKQAVAQRR